MKLFLTCVFVLGLMTLKSAPILADGNPPTTAPADQPAEQPSDDTVREFHAAVAVGDMRMAEKMLGLFPDLLQAPLPNDDRSKQVAPLLTAVENGQTAMAAMLLKHGAPYNTGSYSDVPLFRAAILGHSDIIQLLLDAGANIDAVGDGTNNVDLSNISDVTPLRAALCCGRTVTARFMVSKGAHIDIYAAAGLGWNGWVARQIKEHPEQATAADGWKMRPLTYAVATGSAGTAEILLSHGADPNEVSSVDRGTFLDIAAMNGAADLMAVLLAHGADVNLQNDKNETALDFAEKYKEEDAAQTLRDHGAKHGADL